MLLTQWMLGVRGFDVARDLAKNIFPLPRVDQIGGTAILKRELASA